jgi:hypothetical protein
VRREDPTLCCLWKSADFQTPTVSLIGLGLSALFTDAGLIQSLM